MSVNWSNAETTAPAPTTAQRLLRALGSDFFKEGRPYCDCGSTEERIGYREAQEAQAPATNQSNGK